MKMLPKNKLHGVICKKILTIFFILLAPVVFAYAINLRDLSEKKRQEYLLNLSKEVILNLGPDFYRTENPPEIKGPVIHKKTLSDDNLTKRYYGREYYSVIYPYNKAEEPLGGHSFSARVDIWAENGEPCSVMFGTGMGFQFYTNSYHETLTQYSDRMKELQISYPKMKLLWNLETGSYDTIWLDTYWIDTIR